MALRLGFNMLSGMASSNAEIIVHARGQDRFVRFDDFAYRTGFGRALLVRLAKAGVFGSLDLDRRDSLWHALAQDKKKLPLFDNAPTGAGWVPRPTFGRCPACPAVPETRLDKPTVAPVNSNWTDH